MVLNSSQLSSAVDGYINFPDFHSYIRLFKCLANNSITKEKKAESRKLLEDLSKELDPKKQKDQITNLENLGNFFERIGTQELNPRHLQIYLDNLSEDMKAQTISELIYPKQTTSSNARVQEEFDKPYFKSEQDLRKAYAQLKNKLKTGSKLNEQEQQMMHSPLHRPNMIRVWLKEEDDCATLLDTLNRFKAALYR